MSLQRYCQIALFVSALFSVGPAVAQTQKSIPLFLQESLDSNGEPLPIGKSLERLLVYFEQESGLRFERRQLPWNRAQLMTRQGEGIIYGFSKSPQRLEIYHFSLPVVTGKVWVVSYGEPAPVFLSAQDLKGKVVSIGRGFSHGMEFEKAKNVLFTVQEDSASEAARFKKLVAKHSEVMLWQTRDLDTAEQVSLHIQKTLIPSFNDPQLRDKVFNVSAQAVFRDSMHFASVKGKYETEMTILDQAIQRGVKNGSLAKALRPNE